MHSIAAQPLTSQSPIILAVREVYEEIVAGAGTAHCSVRTLDGISCDVRLGELLLLQGGIASGAHSLLDVFAGVRPRARGTRLVGHHVRIRRGAIGRAAAKAIVSAWSTTHTHQWSTVGIPPEGATATAYLLKVQTDAAADEVTGARWRHWASALSRRNVAVVLSMHRPCSDAPTELAHPAIETHREQSVVREGVRERVGRDVRVLTLHAGRIVAVARPVSADARQTRTREERGTL